MCLLPQMGAVVVLSLGMASHWLLPSLQVSGQRCSGVAWHSLSLIHGGASSESGKTGRNTIHFRWESRTTSLEKKGRSGLFDCPLAGSSCHFHVVWRLLSVGAEKGGAHFTWEREIPHADTHPSLFMVGWTLHD